MKTNNAIHRLRALILAGSIAVLAASADDTTNATGKATAKHHLATSKTNTARKPAPITQNHPMTPSPNSEPERIFDLRSRNFISNPDYHEPRQPAPAKQSGQREPLRIFNAVTRNFEINPAYHEPAGATEGTRHPNRETERIKSSTQTGNFEPKPAFGARW
jgi:hypothetical protein